MKPLVVIGMLGPVLDFGSKGPKRWEKWRPTLSLCQHEDLLIHRLELLWQNSYSRLFERIQADIAQVSPETKVVSHEVFLSNPWDFEEVYGLLHDFAKTYPFDPDLEDYLIHITTGTHVAQICMFLLTESRHFPARLIQTGPPPRDSRDTAGTYAVIDLDLSKYDQIAMRFQQQAREDISFLKSGIETRNPAFNALMERIEKVALNSRDPMLLTGPTGAGKSCLAQRIYELKKSRHQCSGNFVELNCATLRGDAVMSALFGHKKGSFTGALQDRPGLLRHADRGMLFLDEVGELGTDEQSMLLRAVEEKKFLPMGSDRDAESDFQLICGTNRDLSAEVKNGRFRADLLARINLWTFRLPGLRERPEDIAPNLEYELERFTERTGTRVSFSQDAKKRFLAFAQSEQAVWAANFRDLSAAVTRMATLAEGGRITRDTAEEEITRLAASWGYCNAEKNIPHEILGEKAEELDLFDRMQLAGVIEICRQSKTLSEAGRRLFAHSRVKKKTSNDADRLRKYLARFGVLWEDTCSGQICG
ncbi:MAG: RNA repair transcriptional activator RtcR [Desulfobacterales bacterium]